MILKIKQLVMPDTDAFNSMIWTCCNGLTGWNYSYMTDELELEFERELTDEEIENVIAKTGGEIINVSE